MCFIIERMYSLLVSHTKCSKCKNQTEKAALIRSQKLRHYSNSINSLPFLLFLCLSEPIFYLLDKIHYRLTEIRNTINGQAYRIGDFVAVHQNLQFFLCFEGKK